MGSRETAWAIEVEPENYQAILSEGGAEINREFLDIWVERFPEGGYFVRDTERMRLDCTLMSADNFWTLYRRGKRIPCVDLAEGGDCGGAHFFPIETDEVPDHERDARAS